MTAREAEGGSDGSGEHEHDVVELVAACLARIDETREPPSRIVEAFCRDHPRQADALRKRLAHLERAGLSAGPQRAADTRTLGRFQLRGELGRGGMGVVYDAFDPRLGRRVALKALGPRLVISDRARTRFEREIRAVATLNHPRIVPVYEVGEENGIPWYTMELVEGRTLAQVIHALRELELRTDELSTSHLNQATFFERTETDTALLHDSDSSTLLTAQAAEAAQRPPGLPAAWGKTYVETVCRMVHDIADALDHAHAHGVVHRDVKPSNILVDARGRAQLFDFGLARIEDDEALTMTGDFAGTPFYVAPEQVSGKRPVDHRADVYSLGVTLFELLTLQRPFTGKNSQQVFRQILYRDPPLLRRINRLVPRDLETICLTALEKDPERRYQSAGELAADLRRFLEFRPVRARPVGLPTRILRWSRRKPAAATAAVLALLIALGVPIAAFASNIVLTREAERTARQAEKANAINRFLLELLGTAQPTELGIDGTIRDAIQLAAARVESDLADPDVQAGILGMIGSTYLAVEEQDAAEPLLREALALRRGFLPSDSPELLRSLDDLGRCRQKQGDLEEARALFAEALASARAAGDETSELADARLRVLGHMALLRADEGNFAQAREHAMTALELAGALYGPDSAQVAASLLDLGEVFEREGHAAADGGSLPLVTAEKVYRDALERLREAYGPDHPETQDCRKRLAEVLMHERNLPEAVALCAEDVASLTRRLGPRHALVARARMRYALAIHLDQRNDDALAEAREAHRIQLDVLPAGHPDIASGEVVLAQVLLHARQPEEASRLLEDSAEIRRTRGLLRDAADSLMRLARAYYDQVRLEETIAAGTEALALYAQVDDAEEEFVAGVSRVVGLASMGLGRWDDARRYLETAAEEFTRLRGPDAASTVIYVEDLANVLFVQQRWGDAARAYRASLDGRRRRGEIEHPTAVGALVNLAEAEAQLGNTEAAIAAAREAIQLNERLDRGPTMHAARGLLIEGSMLVASSRPEEALGPLQRGVGDLLLLGDSGHRRTFDAARLYGRVLLDLGRVDEAEVRLGETLSSAAALLGPQHPDVRRVAADLIGLHAELGNAADVAYLRSIQELSFKLRDAGEPPAMGGAWDEPLGYGPD